MYFASRTQAGRMLAERLVPKYRYENCAVLALGDGGVVVGAQIARQLHCVLNLLLSAEIKLPREPDAVAGVTSEGTLAYNPKFSSGEIDELVGEYRGFIEEEKLLVIHEMHKLLGSGGTVSPALLRDQNIIVVSDGLASSFAVDLAYQYLKPIKYAKLIFATPLATVQAVDHMHVLADEIYCLDTLEIIADLNHFYDENDLPSHQKVVETISKIILEWK